MPPFRRRVFYIPGYDPFPPRRYRELYRRESSAQSAIAGYRLALTRAATPAGWAVDWHGPGGSASTEITVLAWADLVRRSMPHGSRATVGAALRTAWLYAASGALRRLLTLRRGPVLVALYPFAMLALQAASGLAVAGWAGRAAAAAAGTGAGLVAAAAAALTALLLWRRADRHLHVGYLLHDYAYAASAGGAYPPALAERLDAFAGQIGAALRAPGDEVLVVGHSSGAHLAVSVLARVLAGPTPPDPRPAGGGRPVLALLTLGHVVPMQAFLPGAGGLRADLAAVGASDRVAWVDVTAPGDPCCFALVDPVAVCADPAAAAGAAPRGPLVLSAAYAQTLSPARRRALRGRWFRLHFQYLCAFDDPRPYDYFAITAGPLRLADRFAGRRSSPGRMTRRPGGRP